MAASDVTPDIPGTQPICPRETHFKLRAERRFALVLVGAPLFVLAWPLALGAGPPLETDDPDTPGPNRWEINLSSPFATRDDTWLFQPLLDINYGVG